MSKKRIYVRSWADVTFEAPQLYGGRIIFIECEARIYNELYYFDESSGCRLYFIKAPKYLQGGYEQAVSAPPELVMAWKYQDCYE